MNRLLPMLVACMGLLCTHAQAAKIGETCSSQGETSTLLSSDPQEGVIQCIEDKNSIRHWQAMGAGVALYDRTATCSHAGTIRWNGSAVQYCDGASWKSFTGSGNGALHWSGNWTANTFWCDDGYHIVGFHYNAGCSNNATWFECQSD